MPIVAFVRFETAPTAPATPNRLSMRPRSYAPVSFFIAMPPSVAIRLNKPLSSHVTTFAASVSFMTYVDGRTSVGKNLTR